MTVHLLPPVHHFEGLLFDHPGGSNPRLGPLRLQYTDLKGGWHQLEVPAMEALYLLNMLEQWSKDEGLETLRRSPGSRL